MGLGSTPKMICPEWPRPPLPLGRLFDVLNRSVEFLLELFFVVIDGVQVSTSAHHIVNNKTGLLDVLLIHTT